VDLLIIVYWFETCWFETFWFLNVQFRSKIKNKNLEDGCIIKIQISYDGYFSNFIIAVILKPLKLHQIKPFNQSQIIIPTHTHPIKLLKLQTD
jgi:hypothetical protein